MTVSGIAPALRGGAMTVRWTLVAVACTSAIAACGGDGSADGPRTRPTPAGGTGASGSSGSNASAGAGGDFGNPGGNGAGGQQGLPPIGDAGVCVNLQCQQNTCAGGGSTTISGTVYDPAGNNPLYNVAVYVPNEPVLPLTAGATCDDCEALYTGSPIAATLTDATGRFTLEKAPDGSDIPLIVQIGKWRRQFTIPAVTRCADNPQPDGMLRLPRNRSEGDIPNIAIATGGADTLECLLRRIGVDASEYVPGAGGEGRVHIFRGNPTVADGGGGGGNDVAPDTSPPAPAASTDLWSSVASLMAYDIVLLSCEGDETIDMNQQALHDYADAGGRVFASHFHYSWFNSGPYASENLATWTPESNDIGDINGTIVTTLGNGMPFPKGMALEQWLGTVGALRNGTLPIEEARHNADVSAANTPSQPWIVADQSSEAPGATQYFSFDTPTVPNTNVDDIPYCGRVVYSDLHVGAASGDDPEQPVPTGCSDGELSPQEAALEFMLFDLSACLTPNDRPPQPPVVD
jgi:hypothetical protein